MLIRNEYCWKTMLGIVLLLFRSDAYIHDKTEFDHPATTEITNYISSQPRVLTCCGYDSKFGAYTC